jgi:hypothetical protein
MREPGQELEMYRPVLTRLALRMGLLTMLALIAACGGRPEENEPRPLPEAEGQALRPGEYRSEEFEPPLTFRVGEGWALYTPEAPEVLRIERGETGGLGFTNIREVYEPTKTGSPDVVDAPEDIVGWFRRHPYLRTTNLEPATVGGVEGVRFGVVVGELPEGYHGVCLAIIGSDCVDIARFSDGQMLFQTKGTKARVIVLEDVEGETVTMYFGGTATEFNGLAPTAQKVIDTVKWGGS